MQIFVLFKMCRIIEFHKLPMKSTEISSDCIFRLAKFIAAYIIVPLNGEVDALVFTGGIGENSNIKVLIEYLN